MSTGLEKEKVCPWSVLNYLLFVFVRNRTENSPLLHIFSPACLLHTNWQLCTSNHRKWRWWWTDGCFGRLSPYFLLVGHQSLLRWSVNGIRLGTSRLWVHNREHWSLADGSSPISAPRGSNVIWTEVLYRSDEHHEGSLSCPFKPFIIVRRWSIAQGQIENVLSEGKWKGSFRPTGWLDNGTDGLGDAQEGNNNFPNLIVLKGEFIYSNFPCPLLLVLSPVINPFS